MSEESDLTREFQRLRLLVHSRVPRRQMGTIASTSSPVQIPSPSVLSHLRDRLAFWLRWPSRVADSEP